MTANKSSALDANTEIHQNLFLIIVLFFPLKFLFKNNKVTYYLKSYRPRNYDEFLLVIY